MPALAIILYSGLEQRQRSIENARHDVLLLTNAMAETQQEFTRSVKQMLATLSLLPQIQNLERPACRELFRSVLEQNSNYLNIALTDIKGEVLASEKTITVKNFGDRKHVRGVQKSKEFSIGEFIISRIGDATPAFAFAYPVVDSNKSLKAVLTTAVKLPLLSDFHAISDLPERSFIAVTDHKGIRLFYYPSKKDTNPIGKPIKAESWKKPAMPWNREFSSAGARMDTDAYSPLSRSTIKPAIRPTCMCGQGLLKPMCSHRPTRP